MTPIRTRHSRAGSQKQPARRESSKYCAVLQATRELVEQKGYRTLSIKEIACRAGVSRNVLYNWWDGQINRIVEEALLPNVREWVIPDTGNFKEDIEAFLDLTIDAVHKPNALKGFLVLAGEVVSDQDELLETSRYFRAPYSKIVATILKRAEARDEITTDLNPKHISQVISGSVLQFAISKNPGRRSIKPILTEMILKIAAKPE